MANTASWREHCWQGWMWIQYEQSMSNTKYLMEVNTWSSQKFWGSCTTSQPCYTNILWAFNGAHVTAGVPVRLIKKVSAVSLAQVIIRCVAFHQDDDVKLMGRQSTARLVVTLDDQICWAIWQSSWKWSSVHSDLNFQNIILNQSDNIWLSIAWFAECTLAPWRSMNT